MYEILHELGSGDRVLDLGCNLGSFPESSTRAFVVRLDRDAPHKAKGAYVAGDAAQLPFADCSFAAVVANHSLEHFEQLNEALQEIKRVLRVDGAIFVSVPDASTFTDKLYRWLGKGGGHVNAFTSAEQVVALVSRQTGLQCRAVRILCSSLAILNHRPRQLRVWLLGGGSQQSLYFYNWLSRRIDRRFGTRWSVYGWAFWFGNVRQLVDTCTYRNVCLQCGSGFPSREISGVWKCPSCGVRNPYSSDF